MSNEERVVRNLFKRANALFLNYGTGDYRKDLPKAMRAVERDYDERGELSSLHCLVIRAAARRIDEIAREIGTWGDVDTVKVAADLRAFANEKAQVTA